MLINDEIDKIANLYKRDLEIRFPQYEYSLSTSAKWVRLYVFAPTDSRTYTAFPNILKAWFAPTFIAVISKARPMCVIYYVDPRFTEDILSEMLLKCA